MGLEVYNVVLWVMAGLAVVVFVALQFIEAPYGMTYSPRFGASISNKVGWVLMELPALLVMSYFLFAGMPYTASNAVAAIIAGLYLLHYLRRSLLFPLLMRGRSRMPVVIALSGAIFNVVNAYLIGDYICLLSAERYDISWLWSPQFIVGLIIFVTGVCINWQSDRIVRHLRRPGETRHKIPRGGMFRYVSCASYLGEITEWAGFALLSLSWAGVVFLLWTCANLVPRAARLHRRYLLEFGDEYARLGRRRIFPFIY